MFRILCVAALIGVVDGKAQPQPAWGEKPVLVRPKDSKKCKDTMKQCKEGGSWLFVTGGKGECKYPAAELCPKACGVCDEVNSANSCATNAAFPIPQFMKSNNVDWESFFGNMTQRFSGNILSRETPWLAEFPTFLSLDEADLLVKVAEQTGFEVEEMPKHIRDVWKIDCEAASCRMHPFVNEVYRRVTELLGIPPSNFESLEFLKYGKGQHYVPHMDPNEFGDEEGEGVRAGLRILTVFFYLTEVEEGGQTSFPKAKPKKLMVEPTKGKVVVWANTMSDMFVTNGHAEHSAIPVVKGTKYAANFWIHPGNHRIAESYAGKACYRPGD